MTRPSHGLFPIVYCCLLLLLTACTPITAVSPTPTSTTKSSPVPTPTPGVTTTPVPPTQTSCPVEGTARAQVSASLAFGTDQNIVYLAEKHFYGTPGSSVVSTFERFDVTTSTITPIIQLSGEQVDEPQLSQDGRWILFLQTSIQRDQIQMVRTDGQGLQTLYCGSTISNLTWSPLGNLALFSSYSRSGDYGIYLLDLEKGTVQLELKETETNAGPVGIFPVTWLDEVRAYIDIENNQLGLLDTSRGPNQSMSDITVLYKDQTSTTFNYPCWDAASGYFDNAPLFISHCSGIEPHGCSTQNCFLQTREGPSTIYTEPVTGGAQQSLFTSQTLGIGQMRSATSSLLLLNVDNFSQTSSIDMSQNGLWVLHTDGTGLTPLTTTTTNSSISLCLYSQYPWSNASRDGTMYAYQSVGTGAPGTFVLIYGSWDGSQKHAFASLADGTALSIVGWTTM